MANSSTASPVQPTKYLSDDDFATSGIQNYKLFCDEICQPLLAAAKSGPPELYAWLGKTNEIVTTGGLEVPPPPMSCVRDTGHGLHVIASPWANMAIMEDSDIHADFACEFDLPRRDRNPTPSEKAADLEHQDRYFSAEILAHIFLSYRVTYIQRKHADTPEEETILANAWVLATARACRELIRLTDFALLSNMSFAVVCCIVDLGAHLVDDIWPAALMTPDRVDAAERGLTSDADDEPSISFDDYEHLGFLPLVLPCNRCASSLPTSEHGRPRICTFARRDANPGPRVCLACLKTNEAKHCLLAFCPAVVPKRITIVISDSEESDSPVAVARSPPGPPPARSTVHSRKRKTNVVGLPPPKRGKMTLEAMLEPTPQKLPPPKKRTLTRRGPSTPLVASSDLPSVRSTGLRRTSNESAVSSRDDALLPPSIHPSPRPISPSPPPLSPSNSAGSSFAPTHHPRDATSTVSGETIDVPLVDLEALVTYYESLQSLQGLIDVEGAARRSRDVIETARRALGDLANLQEQINLRRRYLASLQGDLAEADTDLANTESNAQQ
ncbi:hypothetical protein EXIGLDRAFT_782602 [Exidia glandulosa HHB12029]|uniref:Uncharacterized protein n=1 Tax=Exidia glandulosa HHB12029 TaxID=1314781 RepID=A0A166NJZ7_EXIGL|nr:hypothetical protein EXIGLDRAFT_782602 [Exidia glandulosa HHB12029]